MKKYFAIIIFLAVVAGSIFGYRWYEIKMKKVEIGLAEPIFPYRDYTQEELNKMYPQIKYADVATRITPEETYAKFRQALEENNLELALEQLSKESERHEENVEKIKKFFQEEKFNELLNYYPEEIWRGTFGESVGNICYTQQQKDGEFIGCSSFIKNSNGEWKIDSL